jgi:4'-phosphopantetheinyl transferase EntD
LSHARIESEIELLLGGRVRAALVNLPQAGSDAVLHPQERAAIATASPKRVREFSAGRACARRLLESYGVEEFALLSDADRVPRWPRGLLGSISHKAELCAVVVGSRDSLAAVGIDVERDGAVQSRVWPRILRPAEAAWLEQRPAAERARLATLVFSAKEATYKCLFPESRVRLAFADVQIELDATAERFRATLYRDCAPLQRGEVLEGFCVVRGDYALTGVMRVG